VQIIDPSFTGANFTVLGCSVCSADEYGGSDYLGASVQFGIGAAGSEVVFASSNLPPIRVGSNDDHYLHTIPLAYSGIVPGGSRVAVRIADGFDSAKTMYLKVMYTTNIRQGGIYLNNYITHPVGFHSASVATGSTTWTYGSYVQLVQENIITTDYFIRGIHIQHPNNTTQQSQIALAIGPAGYEVYGIMAEIPFMYQDRTSHGAHMHYFPLTTAIKIPRQMRLSVAAAKYFSTQATLVVGVDITTGTFYG
jgi:hypothetical protein